MPRSRQLTLIIASALALVAGVIAYGGSGGGSPAVTAAQAAEYGDASTAAVPAVDAGAALLDVREQEEWDAGHATPAELFTLSRLQDGELPRLAKDAKVFVYCHSGRRAAIAVELLSKAGFTDVTNIGGLKDWQAAGGAVASS